MLTQTRWGPQAHYGSDEWLELFESAGFERPRFESFPTELVLHADRVASLWLSVSSVTRLPERERAVLARRLRAGLEGRYRLTFDTHLYWTRLAK